MKLGFCTEGGKRHVYLLMGHLYGRGGRAILTKEYKNIANCNLGGIGLRLTMQ